MLRNIFHSHRSNTSSLSTNKKQRNTSTSSNSSSKSEDKHPLHEEEIHGETHVEQDASKTPQFVYPANLCMTAAQPFYPVHAIPAKWALFG